MVVGPVDDCCREAMPSIVDSADGRHVKQHLAMGRLKRTSLVPMFPRAHAFICIPDSCLEFIQLKNVGGVTLGYEQDVCLQVTKSPVALLVLICLVATFSPFKNGSWVSS